MSEQTGRGWRVLVVDDEVRARRRISDLLRKHPAVEDILEGDNGMVAVDLIEGERPDIVFLDVQMPKLDGFGVIHMVGADKMPATVFVTAYDSYAIRAFDVDASDYLVKPFSDERFMQTLSRLRIRMERREQFGAQVLDASKKAMAPVFWDRLAVKVDGLTRLIGATDIDWIEADDIYVRLHVQAKAFLYRTTLQQLCRRLDPARFVRIHRSTVVNMDRIAHMEAISHGEFEVVLFDGTHLHLSRTYRAPFEARLGQSL